MSTLLGGIFKAIPEYGQAWTRVTGLPPPSGTTVEALEARLARVPVDGLDDPETVRALGTLRAIVARARGGADRAPSGGGVSETVRSGGLAGVRAVEIEASAPPAQGNVARAALARMLDVYPDLLAASGATRVAPSLAKSLAAIPELRLGALRILARDAVAASASNRPWAVRQLAAAVATPADRRLVARLFDRHVTALTEALCGGATPVAFAQPDLLGLAGLLEGMPELVANLTAEQLGRAGRLFEAFLRSSGYELSERSVPAERLALRGIVDAALSAHQHSGGRFGVEGIIDWLRQIPEAASELQDLLLRLGRPVDASLASVALGKVLMAVSTVDDFEYAVRSRSLDRDVANALHIAGRRDAVEVKRLAATMVQFARSKACAARVGEIAARVIAGQPIEAVRPPASAAPPAFASLGPSALEEAIAGLRAGGIETQRDFMRKAGDAAILALHAGAVDVVADFRALLRSPAGSLIVDTIIGRFGELPRGPHDAATIAAARAAFVGLLQSEIDAGNAEAFGGILLEWQLTPGEAARLYPRMLDRLASAPATASADGLGLSAERRVFFGERLIERMLEAGDPPPELSARAVEPWTDLLQETEGAYKQREAALLEELRRGRGDAREQSARTLELLRSPAGRVRSR